MPRIFSFLLGSSGGGGSGDFFKTFVPVTGSNVIATVTDDTFTFATDGNIRITGDSFTKTMTLALGVTTFVPRSVLYAGQSGIISQSPFDFNFDYTNNGLALGTTISSIFAYGSTSIPWLKVVNEDADGDKPHVLFQTFSDGIVNPALSFVYSRGTESSPTATQAGDVIGAVDFFANDGSGYNYSSTISSIAQGPIGAGSIPSWLYFATTASGGSLPIVAMVLTETQSAYFYGNVYTTLLANQTIPYVDVNSKLTASADLTWNNTLSRLTTGDIKVTNLNPSQLVSTTSLSILQSEAFSANGQLIIGKSTGGFSKATLTAGSNIVITNGSGSITVATSLTPTFTSITVGTITTSLTADRVVITNATGVLTTTGFLKWISASNQLNLTGTGVSISLGFCKIDVQDNFTLSLANNFGIYRPASTAKEIKFYNGTTAATATKRWSLQMDSTTESGSNAGSGFRLVAYSDTGTLIDTPIIITRASGGNIAFVRSLGITGTLTTSSTVISGGYLYIGTSEAGTSQLMIRMNRYNGSEASTSGYANKISLYADAGLNPIIGFGVDGTSLDYVSNNKHSFYTNGVLCFRFDTGVSDPRATFYAQSVVDFTLTTGFGFHSSIISTASSGTAIAIRGQIKPTHTSSASTRFTSVDGTPDYTGIANNNTGYVTGFHAETSLPPNTYTLTNTFGYWCRLLRNVTGGTVTTAIGFYVDQSTNTAGTITTAYGVKIDALTLATTNWQLAVESGNSYFAGSVTVGATSAPGTTLDVQGTLNATGNVTLTSKVTKYNNVTTVGAGVPSLVATSDLTTQAAAIAATTIYAVPAAGAGMYRVSWVATVTRAATTSCVLGGTNGFQLKYTDNNDSVVKTSNPTTTTAFTSATNATGTSVSGTYNAYCKASTNLQYLFDYTSVGGTTMQYDLSIRVEFLG